MPHRHLLVLVAAVALVGVSCSSHDSSSPTTTASTTTTSQAPPSTVPSEAESRGVVVFNAQGNNLDAYESEPPFTGQEVITNRAQDPDGLDINAQICFFGDGSGRFIAGEDTGEDAGLTQGWGIFQLNGTSIGDFTAEQIGKLVPTYQPSADIAESYGCGILSDGRVVTTDVGNQASGPGDGQLIVWFPPFDSYQAAYCKVDVEIATAQGIWVDDQNRVYVASARPPSFGGRTAGIWRYSGLPTSPDAIGGCGRTDGTGAPLADVARKELFIAAGEHGLLTPAGITSTADGRLFASSVVNGVINEYDANGVFRRTVLTPPAGETMGTSPLPTGTPLGIAAGPDGTIYYADIGLVVGPDGAIGPGARTGALRRIVFEDGEPLPPETMASGLAFPDGVGLLPPTRAAADSRV